MRRRRLLLALLLVGACRSAPEAARPVAAPRVATRVRYQLGGPLRGAEASGEALPDAAFEASRALTVRVAIVAAAEPPNLPLASVAERAKLVVLEASADRGLAAAPRRLATARVGPVAEPADLERSLLAGRRPGCLVRELRACLPAGASVQIEVARDSAGAAEDAEVGRTRAALVLGRRESGLDVALEVEDAKSGAEIVSLDGPDFERPGVASWLAALPSPFEGEEARQVVFLVETAPGPLGASPHAAVHELALEQARRELVAQAAGGSRAAPGEAERAPFPDLAATRRALEDGKTARRAMYALATATGARLAEELSVTVDDLSFSPIASSVAAALESSSRGAAPQEVGLAVEKAALASCREILLSDEVPDDLLAALERRGGAALRYLPTLSLAAELERARSLEDLERLIEQQNVVLLEDASPKVRVRAARWLAGRVDLAGYAALDGGQDPKVAAARRREVVTHLRERRSR